VVLRCPACPLLALARGGVNVRWELKSRYYTWATRGSRDTHGAGRLIHGPAVVGIRARL